MVGVSVSPIVEQDRINFGYQSMQNAAQTTLSNENEIIVRHDRLIQKLASRFSLIDFDDLCQIGRLALVEASRTWSPDRGAQLWTYARRAVLGAMIDAVTKELARLHVELPNDNKGCYHDMFESDEAPKMIAEGKTESCDTAHAKNTDVDDLVDLVSVLPTLDDDEVQVLRMHVVEGFNFREIADRTGKSLGAVFRTYAGAIASLRERLA